MFPKELHVALDDLAPIWLRYNNDADPKTSGAVKSLYDDQKEPENEKKPVETSAAAATVEETAPAPVDNSNNNAAEPHNEDKPQPKKPKELKDKELKDLIRDCIDPYADVIRMQKVEHVVKGLVELLDKYGGAPSVVLGVGRDIEKDDLTSVKDNLAKVSLRYHTCGVVRNMVAMVKDTYSNFEMVMPKALVESLAHDIGKIPEFRDSNIYNTSEHPLISGAKLAELFTDTDVHWKDDAIKAVKEHHLSTSDKTAVEQMSAILKQADRKARENELIMFTQGYQVKPFQKWFDPAAFIERLKPEINISRDDANKMNAISFKGVVYLRPNYMYEIARKMCSEANVLDANFFYKSDDANAKLLIAKALRDAGCLADGAGKDSANGEMNGRYSLRYEIRRTTGDKPIREQFLPIKMDERFNINEIESRKISGYLLSIIDIYRK
ncbi:MAG TPA: HD domain-containing protein [Syntrophorhabdaceae bacterium]|nr:HD domain-containing protein [Syntrophorhabdaceae bacterium]